MGLSDRDYYRNDGPSPRRKRGGVFGFLNIWSATVTIIAINVVMFMANGLFTPTDNRITQYMVLSPGVLGMPLQWYRFITCAFAHSPENFQHILFNMITLFFFGPPVEQRYGKKEFFLIYFASVLSCGLVWSWVHLGSEAHVLGASGAISTVVILFALNYPHAQVLLFGIIPMPAWLLGVLFIVLDTFGTFDAQTNVAHDVHLTGAVLAFVYFFMRWHFSALFRWRGRKAGPALRVYRQEREMSQARLEIEVDRILRKISTSGEESLSSEERETLREASRRYQDRRR